MNRDAQQNAIRLAQHYFAALAGATGLPWSSDNDTEIELLVINIIDAASSNARRTVYEDLQMHARLRGLKA